MLIGVLHQPSISLYALEARCRVTTGSQPATARWVRLHALEVGVITGKYEAETP